MGADKSVKVCVLYDEMGNITALMEMKTRDKKRPPVELQTVFPQSRSFEIELSDNLAKLSLIELHTKYKVDIAQRKPRLIPNGAVDFDMHGLGDSH